MVSEEWGIIITNDCVRFKILYTKVIFYHPLRRQFDVPTQKGPLRIFTQFRKLLIKDGVFLQMLKISKETEKKKKRPEQTTFDHLWEVFFKAL